MMDMSTWSRIFGITGLLYIVISTEPVYRDSLYELSIPVIEALQKHSSTNTEKVFGLIQVFLQTTVPLSVYVSFVACERGRALYYAILFSTVVLFSALLKLIYLEARPFWSDSSVDGFYCPNDFGNPSQFTLGTTAVFYSVAMDYIENRKSDPEWVKIIVLIVCFTNPFVITMTTLYNGTDALNQLLYGWLLGICVCLLVRYWIKDFIITHTYNLLFNQSGFTTAKYTALLSLGWATVGFTGKMMKLVYSYNDLNFTAPTSWTTNFENSCSKTPDDFNNETYLYGAGFVSVSFGAYLGVLIQSYFNWNTSESYTSHGFLRYVMKAVIAGGMALPFLTPGIFGDALIGDKISSSMTAQIDIYYYFPLIGLGAAMYGLTDVILSVFKADIFQMSNESESKNIVKNSDGELKIIMIQL